MRELLLVRFGEIFLKGLNRPYFMKELVKKVRYAVQAVNGQVWLHDSRVFVSDYMDQEECIRRVTKVFGVHSVCPAVEREKEDFSALCAQASAMMAGLTGTFKVYARRSDKRYPMDSGEINRELGRSTAIEGKVACTDGSIQNTVCGTPMLIYGPGEASQAHVYDEYVLLEDFHNSVNFFYGLVEKLLG